MRVASFAAAASFSFATIATLVSAMPPPRDAAALAQATAVTILPSRIEVVGVRAAPARRLG